MADVKVSVVIPVYNAMPYLGQCLDSLSGQTFQDIEILCVNDGSHDGTAEFLHRYQKESDKIQIFDQRHQGAGAARNLGLSHAKGKYVIFLDADDFFDAGLIEKVFLQAERTESDVILFDIFRFDNQTKERKTPRMNLNQRYIPPLEVFSVEDIPESVFQISLGAAWNKFCRTEFLKENNLKFQEIPNSNGVFFSFAILLSARRISVVNERLLYYRSNNPKSMVGQIGNSPLCFMAAWQELYEMARARHEPALLRSFSEAFCVYAKHRLSEFRNRNSFRQTFVFLKDAAFFDFGFKGAARDILLSDEAMEWVSDIESLEESGYIEKYCLEIEPDA